MTKTERDYFDTSDFYINMEEFDPRVIQCVSIQRIHHPLQPLGQLS